MMTDIQQRIEAWRRQDDEPNMSSQEYMSHSVEAFAIVRACAAELARLTKKDETARTLYVQASATIDRLTKEIEELRDHDDGIVRLANTCEDLTRRLDAASARAEANAKDAERLDGIVAHLTQYPRADFNLLAPGNHGGPDGEWLAGSLLDESGIEGTGATLRDAIDAFLLEQQPATPEARS